MLFQVQENYIEIVVMNEIILSENTYFSCLMKSILITIASSSD